MAYIFFLSVFVFVLRHKASTELNNIIALNNKYRIGDQVNLKSFSYANKSF